jgi:hypothetical protein
MQHPAILGGLLSLAGGTALAGSLLQPVFRLSDFPAPLTIDNWLSPMAPGHHVVFHELEDGDCSVNDVVVTRGAKRDFQGPYAGLAARAVSDTVWSDDACNGRRGRLLEDTTDWYAQDRDGNVWYVGERTIEYFFDGAGHPIGSSTEGSWEAGRHGAKAGIVMFAHPVPGTRYRQEYLPGVAEDEAQDLRVNIDVHTALGHFSGCLRTRESTPLAPGDIEFKTYCPNLGLVLVDSPHVHGGAEAVDLGLH